VHHPTARSFFGRRPRRTNRGAGHGAVWENVPTRTLTWRCVPHAIHLQQGVSVVGQFVAGKERNGPIGPPISAEQQAACIAQGALPHHPGGHHFVHGAEGNPDPGIPVDFSQFLQRVRWPKVFQSC